MGGRVMIWGGCFKHSCGHPCALRCPAHPACGLSEAGPGRTFGKRSTLAMPAFVQASVKAYISWGGRQFVRQLLICLSRGPHPHPCPHHLHPTTPHHTHTLSLSPLSCTCTPSPLLHVHLCCLPAHLDPVPLLPCPVVLVDSYGQVEPGGDHPLQVLQGHQGGSIACSWASRRGLQCCAPGKGQRGYGPDEPLLWALARKLKWRTSFRPSFRNVREGYMLPARWAPWAR